MTPDSTRGARTRIPRSLCSARASARRRWAAGSVLRSRDEPARLPRHPGGGAGGAIFAAALSTANGMILHGAIGLTYDIYRNLRRKLVDDHALIRGTQVVLMVMAVIA